MLGGALPPPVIEVKMLDNKFQPSTIKIAANQSIRFQATGTLNHIVAIGDLSSPLLRPGNTWILNAAQQGLAVGQHSVQCEVTCMKCTVEVEEVVTRACNGRANAPAPPEKENFPEQAAEPSEEASSGSGEEYDDPRIDGLVAQLKAQSKIAQPSVFSPTSFVRVSKADEASDDEDEAEYLRQRQRGRGDASAIS